MTNQTTKTSLAPALPATARSDHGALPGTPTEGSDLDRTVAAIDSDIWVLVPNCYQHAASGMTGVFAAKYDQYAERNGQTFTLLGVVDINSYDSDECGEMFFIRFADGTEIQAWPEEVVSAMKGTVLNVLGAIASVQGNVSGATQKAANNAIKRYALASQHTEAGLVWSVGGAWSASSIDQTQDLMTGPEVDAFHKKHPKAQVVDVLVYRDALNAYNSGFNSVLDPNERSTPESRIAARDAGIKSLVRAGFEADALEIGRKDIHEHGKVQGASEESAQVLVSLDGGKTFLPATSGVRIIYKNVPVPGEDEPGELHLNATSEGVITDLWVSREEPLDHNLGTSSALVDDLIERLVDDPVLDHDDSLSPGM